MLLLYCVDILIVFFFFFVSFAFNRGDVNVGGLKCLWILRTEGGALCDKTLFLVIFELFKW